MTVLDSQLWPEMEWRPVSAQLEELDSEQQRRFARTVAIAVLQAVMPSGSDYPELADPAVTDARLEAIEQELDERAWAAQDADDEPGYVHWFRQARAASGVIASRFADPRDAAGRTLYEARHALEDDGRLREIIRTATS